MNKLKIVSQEGLTKVYIDDVELKGIRSVSYKQTIDSCAVAKIEFTPEIEIETEAIVEKKPRALYDKCGECKWLDINVKHVIGCLCVQPERRYHATASYKYLTQKACKKFERKEEK